MDMGGNTALSSRLSSVLSIAAYATGAIIGLLPALLLPFLSLPVEFEKSYIFFGTVSIALILLLLGSIFGGRLSLPRSLLLFAVLLLPLAYLIAAVFSDNATQSLFGTSFEIDTVLMITALAVTAILGATLFSTPSPIQSLVLFSLLAAAVVAVVEIIQLTFGLPFDSFSSSTANLVGKWNDLGIYCGLLFILAMHISVFSNSLSRSGVWILRLLLTLSALGIIVVNFFNVWIALAIAAALFLFARAHTLRRGGVGLFSREFFRRIPLLPLLTLLIALMFLLFHAQLSAILGEALSIFQVEARPSWQSTFDIAAVGFDSNPLLGSGPNTFGEQWLLHKPAGINETPFWGVQFTQGVGIVPTTFATAGLLGGAAWLFLLGLFLYRGYRLFRATSFAIPSVTVLSYISALYLLGMAVFYLPGIALMVLAFLALGIFVAYVERERGSAPLVIPLTLRPFGVMPLAGVLVGVLLAGGVGFVLYQTTNRVIGATDYYGAIESIGKNDLPTAESRARASTVREPGNDAARLLAEIGFAVMNQIAGSQEGTAEERLKNFESVAKGAIEAGFFAVQNNPHNPANWVTLGRLYELLFSVGAKDAYDDAKLAYEEALRRSPHDPSLHLMLARLEATNDDGEAARGHLARALETKRNYTAAVFFLSQLEISEGKIADAISSSEAALALSPQETVLWFQLGFLHYSTKNFRAAAQAFERAVAIQENYSNARYFLGLSYYELKRPVEALAQFMRVAELNPTNAEVAKIVSNLSAGKAPLADLKPPVSTPEKRGNLPVPE